MTDVSIIGAFTSDQSPTLDVLGPSNFGKLKQKMQLSAAKLKPPVLSGAKGDVLEFDAGPSTTPNKTPKALKFLEVLSKKCTPTSNPGTNQKQLTLHSWKEKIEEKMKIRRDREMDERQELYRLEMEQVKEGTVELDASDSEPEFQTDPEDFSDDEEVDEVLEEKIDNMAQDLQNHDDESVQNIANNQPQDSDQPETFVWNTEVKHCTSSPQPEMSLQKNAVELSRNSTFCDAPLEELQMEQNLTTQQANDEMMLLLTNPFNVVQNGPQTRPENFAKFSSQNDIFPSISQQTQPSFIDENVNDGGFLKPDAAVGLNMEKNMTSQEVEREILGLLTNPFQKDDSACSLARSASLKNFSTNSQSPMCSSSLKRRNFVFLDDEDENAVDGVDFGKKDTKFRKLFVSDDEENTIAAKASLSQINCADCEEKVGGEKTGVDEVDENEETDGEGSSGYAEDVVRDEGEVSQDGEEGSQDEDAGDASDRAEFDLQDDEEEKMASEMRKNRFVDKKTKLVRREFVENEAELSGSEVDSDEEDDVPSDEDELEMEEGDLEDLPSDDELRAQVEKIHNKQMLDDDNKRLLLYKDAYLPDGDMHCENDVIRRFRWRKAEEDDIKMENKDEPENDEIQILEEEGMESWRQIQRERAQFLLDKGLNTDEFEEKSIDADADTCKLFRLNRINIRRSTSTYSAVSFDAAVGSENKTSMMSCSEESFDKVGRESFLNRQQSVLSRIVNENSNSAFSNLAPLKSLFFSEKSMSSDDSSRFASVKRENGRKIQNGRPQTFDLSKKTDLTQDSVFSLL